jgi:inward rectifier potassium channel
MPLLKNINPFSKHNPDTGFGVNAANVGGRFINKDGSFNLRKEGWPLWKRISIYYYMLSVPRWKFILIILGFFVLVNVFFSSLYLLIGVQELQGVIATTAWGKMREVFYFSTETFTTVGYGRVNPVGDLANVVSSIESMSGFLSFAIATGLIYGRFSKPRAFLAFSHNALISPFQGGTALMFRLVAYKNNHHITNAGIKVGVGLTVTENGQQVFKFYDLELERSRVDMLSMSWTVVHPINERSPLLGFSREDMELSDVEIYVSVQGFDDVFSSNVLQRTSYTYKEFVYGARFVQMYHESEDGQTTVLELDKLNKYELVELPD